MDYQFAPSSQTRAVKPDLSCIIVNYNHGSILGQCLESLTSIPAPESFETIVVNNSPEDELVAEAVKPHPRVRLIQNARNLGFSKANNQAVRESVGQYILFLNPDAELLPEAVDVMRAHLDANPQTALVGPKVLDPDGALQYSCRRFPNLWTGLFNRYSLLSRWFPDNRFTTHYLMKDFDHASIRKVDWVSGCCMMIRRSDFEQVGGFDENYFLFNEDVDLCFEMKKRGRDVVYLPEARINHKVTASSGKVSWRIIIKRHQGMSYFYRKHYQGNALAAVCVHSLIFMRCMAQLAINQLK
ncbi:MAG: glycosyltransferase family 2 protein [Candidatus Nitrohelix vancouverensis]|uniref:Glycosyltransferase family 2 protein n=1 Tax=Candidatus Nitrohelix vancouverensis TaxID=2705534 RepID=A0A7T0G3G4_9BACT|nr:MAG: glycosyltransferase family 2 protein [Candidatus Nitrohelix vancouverensis]